MFKCKICKEQYKSLEGLYDHIEEEHEEMIPRDMTVQQYYYYMKTGKSNGNCVICKGATSWNSGNNKYNRFCGSPKCKEKYVETFRERMIGKHGKVHLLNDPEQQKKMLANRSISGEYTWTDNKHVSQYTGSYELDFLRTMDLFFNWDPEDVIMPSPHVYYYEYEGEKKFYIPDVFIPSLQLEIEIKDGGDNPNNHHKIQAVDKVKEKKKDEVLKSQKSFHYMKLVNKNYTNLFIFLNNMKIEFEKHGSMDKIPRMFLLDQGPKKFEGEELLVKKVSESIEPVEENTISFYFINSVINKNSNVWDKTNGYIPDINKFKDSYINLIKNTSSEAELAIIRKDINKLMGILKHNTEMDNPNINMKDVQNLVQWIKRDVTYLLDEKENQIRKKINNFIGNTQECKKPMKFDDGLLEVIVLFDRKKCRTGKAFSIFDKSTSIIINRNYIVDRQRVLDLHVFTPDNEYNNMECMVYHVNKNEITVDKLETATGKLKPVTQMFDINKTDNREFVADIYHSILHKRIDIDNIIFTYSGTYKSYIETGCDK